MTEDPFLKAFMRRFEIEGDEIKEDYGRDVIVTAELNGFTPRPMNFDELIAWYTFLDSKRHDIPNDPKIMEKIIEFARKYLDEIIFTEDIEKEIKERSEKGKNADIVSLMFTIYKRANTFSRMIQHAILILIEERLSKLLAEHFIVKGEIPLSEDFIEKHREEYEELAGAITAERMREILDRVSKALTQGEASEEE